jgi:hypothetical protein
MKKFLLVLFGIFVVSWVIVSLGDTHAAKEPPPPPAPTAAEQAATKLAEHTTAEACRQKLVKAQRLDLLYDLKLTMPPTVVVGPAYAAMPFDAREGLARTVNCVLVLGTTNVINFDLLDYRTHKVVGRWEYGQLQAAE